MCKGKKSSHPSITLPFSLVSSAALTASGASVSGYTASVGKERHYNTASVGKERHYNTAVLRMAIPAQLCTTLLREGAPFCMGQGKALHSTASLAVLLDA